MKNLVWVFLFLSSSCVSAKEVTVCPTKLEVGENGQNSYHSVDETKELNLVAINFYLGHPREKSLLKIDDQNSVRNGNSISIKLGTKYQNWVACHYARFNYYFVQNLEQSTSCSVVYSGDYKETDQKGRPLPVIEKFSCE